MSKMKRAVAIALAAAMAMGSTLTGFAAETGSDSSTGEGKNEGHLDKKVINVVLPTLPAEGSPFDYVMDPEGLIQETKGAAYDEYTFPDEDTDTGVYFRTGEKEFSNTSQTLKVINKSSCDMKITVSAQAIASDGGKDVTLAADDQTGLKAESPLYLGLNVGASSNAAQVVSTTKADVAKVISGNDDNFETQYTGSGYEYVVSADAAEWKALEFSLTGKVFEGDIAADATAPKVTVTWAFEETTDPANTGDEVTYEETAEPEILSVSDYVKTDPKAVVIKFSLGKGPGAINPDKIVLYQGANKGAPPTTVHSIDMNEKTVTISTEAGFIKNATADVPIYLSLVKDGQAVKELSGTVKIKADYDPARIISITDFDKNNQEDVVIKFSLGEGNKKVEADNVVLYQGASKGAPPASVYTVDMTNMTVTIKSSAGFIANATADVPIYLSLTKGGQAVEELSGSVKIIQ